MKQQLNPAVVAGVILLLVVVVGLVVWRGVVGESPGGKTDPATKDAIKKTTVDIPQATGAAPGMTAPPVKEGGGVSTPLMPGGGMPPR